MSGASGSTAPRSVSKLEKRCKECGLVEGGDKKLKWCQRCHSASYCGAECQKADWPRHKPICKEYQDTLKLSQEAHGDEGALGTNRQNQWLHRVEPFLYPLMATLLNKSNRDTHIILLTIERVEKRPYFKVQHCTVVPVDAIAVAGKNTKAIQDKMYKLKMRHQQATYAYGLIVITCSNDSMVPVHIMHLDSRDYGLFHLSADDILRTINEEPIT
eukprot:gene11007-18971_t